MNIQRTGSAIVIGGSIGGLLSAAALLKVGWDVKVYERARSELAGRGAGIVTHDRLVEIFGKIGASTDDLGVLVENRISFDLNANVVTSLPYRQVVTSWDRIYQILRALLPKDTYRLDHAISAYTQTDGAITATFAGGQKQTADVIIGADGFRSSVRQQLLPDVEPAYSGYVVWRAVADEKEVPPEIFKEFGFFAPNGTQIVGYPIAGKNNDLRVGHRRYNFVWYSAVDRGDLRDMLTDETGKSFPVSIPPPRIRKDVLSRMEEEAARRLPGCFVDIIRNSARPFFTPIYDHCCPVFAKGRVAVLGDAACVARPHVGMGVTKAAEDALALADKLSVLPVEEALRSYSDKRVPAARRAFEQAQYLGSLIFDTDPAKNLDGRDNPMLETIVRDTAIPVL